MVYTYMRPVMNGELALYYAMRVKCSACNCILGYERDVKGVKFCPNCGHKLRRITLNLSPEKIVATLNRYIEVPNDH